MRAIDYFDKAAEAYPERVALVDGNVRYTYAELNDATHRLARAMWADGVLDEERAAIFSPNDARVMVCMVAIMRSGATWVPINHRNAADANIAFMNYAETRWLFYHSSFSEQAKEMQARVPSLRHLICIDRAANGDPSLAEFMEKGSGAEERGWADPRGNPGRMMGLVPTGGTTGPAKGVRVSSESWGTFVEMAAHYWQCEDVAPICLSTAPLSHAAGVVAVALFTLGATNVILPRFDALEVLRSIAHHRVTHIFLPPTAFYALLAHPQLHEFDHSSLRLLLLAASPVSPDRVKQGVEVLGPCICQSYGQTEAPMLMTWLDRKTVAAAAAGEHPERLRSCGKATYAVRLGIMDDEGRLLPANQAGEIVARGSLVSPGYHNMPEATAEIRTFGWHHTGDVGYRDEDGYFYIVDRKKDMIISGGFNVYSGEVEAAIMEMPQVYECAVIGVPHETWGEAVKGLVVVRPGEQLTEDEVIAHCKKKLGSVKAPKTVEFRAEIPKTPAGKVDRKTLRAPYWKGAERGVH
ncbi:MAG TPA: AMP-binding protein [Candidatus Acidoferrum sp.]|nr:AMP-binding protein [Candidatus Acidoferrum sp.]